MPQTKQGKQDKARKTSNISKTRKTRGGSDAAQPVYGYYCDGADNVTQCTDTQGICLSGGNRQKDKKRQNGGFNTSGSYCDGNLTQCSDSFGCDQGGGANDDYAMYKYYKKLYKSLKGDTPLRRC